MVNLDSLSFLTVGSQAISLGQALRYLQRSGKLTPMVNEIVGQHILLQEIESRSDLQVSVAELEQAVHNFRERQQLTDADAFEKWLVNSGFSYATFLNRVSEDLRVEKLKAEISASNVPEYFKENHAALDQIKLTYIVANDQDTANELAEKIKQGQASFEEIARDCINETFLNNSDKLSLKRETIRRGQIRAELKELLENAQSGAVLGPCEIGQRWWVLKVDEIVEAELAGDLKQQLETEFFQQWLTLKMQQSPVSFSMA